MHTHIEHASPADIPDLCVLLSLLFAQEAEFTPNTQAQTKGLTQIIHNPALGTILVARNADGMVGMVSLLFSVSTALGGKVAWLEDMVVAPQARGSGIGSQLLTQAIALARSQGCKRITLLTDGNNAAAQHFYAQHGFSRSEMLPMRLSLDD
ncbi:MAG TPA: GNAT family N-acetyltransferase [bacterium]|nr:GNAT family N-acetyltransferase [bacterium]